MKNLQNYSIKYNKESKKVGSNTSKELEMDIGKTLKCMKAQLKL